MAHNPLEQFEIKSLFSCCQSFTNSSLAMVLCLSIIVFYLNCALKAKALVPSRLQVSAELLHNLILDMVNQNIGQAGMRFLPFVFTLFIFILTMNLFGMLPYGFTVTSHITITFAMAFCVFVLRPS